MCAEIIEQVRQIPGVSGIHVMAPGYEQAIPEILGRAGIRQRHGPDGPGADGHAALRAGSERRRAH
jgi:methylenetetrahydrofolate reductase (NADPH)